ncbi:MAG: hypothetical protein ACE37H_07965 [Phycisphaeraceae bacterium]
MQLPQALLIDLGEIKIDRPDVLYLGPAAGQGAVGQAQQADEFRDVLRPEVCRAVPGP